jgi:hypothetical protein
VKFTEGSFFDTETVIWVPYTREPDYFKANANGLLPVWTFDGTGLAESDTADLGTDWPHNILDKAAITPSLAKAKEWTKDKQIRISES